MITPFEPIAEALPDCRDALLQAIMEGGEELIGEQALTELYQRAERRAGSPGLFSALHLELQASYGALGGQGVAVRLGRASFKHGLRKWGEAAGLTTAAFRLQPSQRRARSVLIKLSELMDSQFGTQAELSEDSERWFWRVAHCPACSERRAASPDCHLLTGLLQEALSWAGGGRFFRVTEVECCAVGAPACLFQIDKKSLD